MLAKISNLEYLTFKNTELFLYIKNASLLMADLSSF